MRGKRTPDEVKDFIRDHKGKSNAELAEMVNQQFAGVNYTAHAVQCIKDRMGLKQEPLFPQPVRDFIAAHYQGTYYRDLADMVSAQFRIKYSKDQIAQYCRRNGLNNNMRDSRRHRAKLGYEIKAAFGYTFIKVRNDVAAKYSMENYMPKHRYIWEQTHGPIPENYCVVFLDGDKTNFSLDNLMAIPRNELLAMNRHNLYFSDPELTRSGALVAKLICATNERKKSNQKAQSEEESKNV